MDAVDTFALWLRSTSISEFIRVYPWGWPAAETLHFIGLSMLIGCAGMFDLRLLGFMPKVPIKAVHDLLFWAKVGFALNLVTGIVFFVGAPDQYIRNTAWWGKVLFLVIAGANAFLFETKFGRQVADIKVGEETPVPFKVAAGVSLVSWFFVTYWGRMLPFIGNAF
ncbi:MAG: hypothetical protein HOP14_07585 [Acidobacteria bacterium]|nr:hypothetical protein [Acidobacteriota bacterium]